jgi:hypothetical protein
LVPHPSRTDARFFGTARTGIRATGSGEREIEPHECEWLKQVTGFGEGQTVKVARNGEGGHEAGLEPRDEARLEGLGRTARF